MVTALESKLNQYQLAILFALNRRQNNRELRIYAGTADPVAVAKRRAKNKVARRQRKVNSR